jgi:hypothetical protein
MSSPSYSEGAAAVRRIHARRVSPIADLPDQHAYCVEDRQTWPCATIAALDDLEHQAEQYEREHSEADAREAERRDEEPF